MSRTARLLELMITLQTRPQFRVQELADEYGVSRRTMLRDLHALSEMGVPLAATPGRHGGYSVIRRRKLLPLSLSADEAIGMLLSYESFLRYAQSPFAGQSLSAITKIRQALPADVVRELDRLRDHVTVLEPGKAYEAPSLPDLLEFALEREHLSVQYESASGKTVRTIFPYGLFAYRGYWYCACFDYRRKRNLMLRCDRLAILGKVDGLPPRPPTPVTEWLDRYRTEDEQAVRVGGTLTPAGMKHVEVQELFGVVESLPDGSGRIDLSLPESELEYYATRALTFGTDLRIEEPAELVDLIFRKANAVAAVYRRDA